MKYGIGLLIGMLCLTHLCLGGERELFDRGNRFLDKSFPEAELTPSVTGMDSFEDWDDTRASWEFKDCKAEQSGEHFTDGKQSMKLVFETPKSFLRYNRGFHGWDRTTLQQDVDQEICLRMLFYDEIRLDVFNPGPALKLMVSVPESTTLEYDLKSGANEIKIKTADLRRSSYRPTELTRQIKFSLPGITASTPLYFDNIRWIGPGLGKNLIHYAKCFDFGLERYNRPFFQTVAPGTGYTKERGFGWKEPATSQPQDLLPVIAVEGTGRRPDDQLLRDALLLTKTPLLVDLPDGKYRLQLVENGIGFYTQPPCFYDLTVSFDGGAPQVLRRRAKNLEECFRFEYGLDQTDWVPNDDLWKKFRGLLIRPLECDFEVKGGQVSIQFRTQPGGYENLSFAIIYPLDKTDVVEPDIAALWRDLRYRFQIAFPPASLELARKFLLPGLHDEMDGALRAKRLTDLAPTADESKEGYVLFNRDGVEEVYPDTVPARAECSADYAAAGPAGEIESYAVSLMALRDLKDVGLELGDFVGPNGAKIGKDRCDVRVVNCVYRMSGNFSHGDWCWMVMPWHLVKRPAVDIPAQTCRRWWINLDIPADAPAGAYTATATLKGQGLEPRQIKLTLDVLPIKLDPVPANIEQSMDIVWPKWWAPLPDRMERYIRLFVVGSNLKNLDTPRGAPWKEIYQEAEKLCVDRRMMELNLLKRYGFNFAYFDTFEVIPKALEAVQANSPIPTYNYQYEPNKGVQELNKLKCFTGGWKKYILNNQSEDAVTKLKKESGLPVILSMNISQLWWSDVQQQPGIYRFEAGYLLWRTGADGANYGPWHIPWRDPYNPTDGHVSEWGDFIDPASTGQQPAINLTTILEELREGIQDFRYIATLERLIKANPEAAAAKEGQDYLDKLRQDVKPGSHYFEKIRQSWDENWVQKSTAWKGKDYREARRRMADLITKLQAKGGT